MAFDGFVTRAVVHELSQKIRNSRVHKIYQPHQTDLVFNLRAYGQNLSLLISANPSYPRIHLTDRNYTNPLEPPMFCMLLRKHLEGGVVEDIKQIGLERVIHIDFKVKDELGDVHTKRLIVEIMGRHSNIILINPETNVILDGIKHITAAITSYRQILPGKEYVPPPNQDKLHPLDISKEQFFSKIQLNEGKLDKQIVDTLVGTSPAIAKEVLHLAGLPTKDNIWNAFHSFRTKVENHQYIPSVTAGENKTDFSIIPLTYLSEEYTEYETVNLCLEDFYSNKAERDTVRQKSQDLHRFVLNEKQKNEKKINYLYKDLEEAKDAEKFKLYGELLTAHLHLAQRGDKEIEVINYYDENQSLIKIPLDPLKTPSENSQAFFKKYNKLKSSQEYIREQLGITKSEIDYLDSILALLENASVEDIEDIREELVEQSYLRDRSKQKKKKKKNPEIEKYVSTEGQTIYVGKNNKQNDYLTQKVASPYDTWLHTKDIPGSHVVIKGKDFGEDTLMEAAKLAAYYSKAKHSSQVPVDYTYVKHVKKPNGAKPGFVIYENQKTLFVTPEEKLVEQLKSK